MVIGAGYLLVQVVVVLVYLIAGPLRRGGGVPGIDQLSRDGFLLALATIFGSVVGAGLCVFFAWLRKGPSVRDYLGLRWPAQRAAIFWFLAVLALATAGDLITTQLLHRPLVPEVMVDLYRNAGVRPLLWIAIIAAAPLFEEFVFRGFLFTGLLGVNHSWRRELGVVLATSGLWALIHLQYDAWGMANIFCGGILLGYARLRTGSLLLCLLMHATINLLATVEVEVLLL